MRINAFLNPFSSYFSEMKRVPKMVLITVLMNFLFTQLYAQSIPVGLPFFEDALRRGQLLERLDSNVSFNIRPIHATRAMGIKNVYGLDTNLFPLDTLKYAEWANLKLWKDRINVQMLPVYVHTQYNKHHPYGWSDGPRIPNRGFQFYGSGGVYVKAGRLELQYRPEFVFAQNKEFQNPPFRPRNIDNPDRMGTEKYQKFFVGQSFAKLNFGPIAVGVSNENIWWGPGMKNAIIMSNNAPGFRHFTINTNKPIVTRYGTIEAQLIGAALEYSGFFPYPLRYSNTWPPIAPDVRPDSLGLPKYHSYVSGAVFSLQPKWTPGLFFGASRVVQVTNRPEKLTYYLSAITEGSSPDEGEISLTGNQIISVFGRYLLKESHAEVYFELGREDWFWDMEDLITNPYYTTAWMAGFRKMYKLGGKDRWLQVYSEITKIQAPVANYSRSVGYSFYTHTNRVGWSHRGQVLGAGIGPGSNMNTLGVVYGKGFTTYGFYAERLVHNEDLLYNFIDYLKLGDGSNPFFIDDSKHYVDWSLAFTAHTSYQKFMVGYHVQLLRTYNFQWNYDPYGGSGPFRFGGLNVWSFNADISMVYRF